MEKSSFLLEGWLSVRAALIANSRDVYEILLEKGKTNARLDALKKRAKEQSVPVRFLSRDELDDEAEGRTHGGALARVGPRKFKTLDELGRGPSAPFLALLDGVEDPYNFGQAVRALHAAGAHGVVLRPRNWTTAAATVGRASAGSTEFMPMAVVDSDEALVEHLRARALQLVCTDLGKKTTSLFDAKLTSPLLVAIGGERRGVSKTLLKNADLTLQIPYGRNFKQSLGTTAATSVVAFEIMRQRS